MSKFPSILTALSFVFLSTASLADEYGQFSGIPKVHLPDDGRSLILLEEFSYTDRYSRNWSVRAGYEADGASIPSIFWSFIGGPLSGKYRNASILHDYFCEYRGPSSDQVHTMFHEAMLAGGVPERKAWIVYKAVDVFGKNWEIVEENVPDECKAGEGFDPSKCVFNDAMAVVDTTIEATPERLETFFADLSEQGYADEVLELREAAKAAGMHVIE